MPKPPRSRVQLSPERRAAVLTALKNYAVTELDEPLSDFRANELLDFFLGHLGPPVYNQGVHDAVAYMQQKLSDIDGEVHEPEA